MLQWSWWVSFKDPRDIWKEHPTIILYELLFIILALLSLKHAFCNGGRWPYLWMATLVHGLTTESLSYFVPDVDNFWHAQSSVMLLGKRLPLHLPLLYPVFLYQSYAAITCLKLPWWAEPFAVGLGELIFDLPYDMMGIKLLWWTWHDTDPNIYDRHYWVPWTSYIFHLSFGSTFIFLMNAGRKYLTGHSGKDGSAGFSKELVLVFFAGLFTFPVAVVTQFVPFYHVPHDLYGVHTENTVMGMIGVYALIAWIADRHKRSDGHEAKSGGNLSWLQHETGQAVVLYYAFFVCLVIGADPEQVISTGLHQSTGSCNVTMTIMSVLGQALPRKPYLCTENYDEHVFDWHCLPGGQLPPDNLSWYSICGTAYTNHAEYIYNITAFCLLGFTFYRTVLNGWVKHETRVKAE